MSGLVKAKKYDWKDSNLALFGSDTEKNVKKESAQTEPAWQGAGAAPGIKIWRIQKFQVTDWPEEDYGSFYDGDSYIILNTYKDEESEQLLYDVHFWIGKNSTQDEYGTAAYKTVELDTFLDDVPVQHREVQGHESDLFKSYFKYINCMKGGAETGFRKVKPQEYTPRLLHFSGTKKHIAIKEVSRSKDRLNSGDVFILDLGLEIYQWNGSGSNKDERFKAVQFLQTLKSERNGKPNVETLEEADVAPTHKFYTSLNEENEDDDEPSIAANQENQLFRLSDDSGSLKFSEEKSGAISEADLDTKDVFIVDTKKECFVWVGNGTSTSEKKNAMTYAHNYLMKSDHPLVPVSILKEGCKSKAWSNFRVAITA